MWPRGTELCAFGVRIAPHTHIEPHAARRYDRVVSVPTAPIAGGSLIAGYLTARMTGVRPLGGVVLAGAGAYLTRRWRAQAGSGTAAALLLTYLAGFGASHPLAKRIGAWPAVFAVAGASGAASWVLADRAAGRQAQVV